MTEPEPHPLVDDSEHEPECWDCANPVECNCETEFGEDCWSCNGSGYRVIEHCCLCGGSPYCNCCRKCGECVATCKCPIEQTLSDGTVRVL